MSKLYIAALENKKNTEKYLVVFADGLSFYVACAAK